VIHWLVVNRLHDATWLQAYSSVAVLIISLITLIILCRYAYDTYRLAQTSVAQVEHAQTPFLALITAEREIESGPYQGRLISHWAIQNQGNGAAVNIAIQCRYERPDIIHGIGGSTQAGSTSTDISKRLNPIAVGVTDLLELTAKMTVIECVITYESLQGRVFKTRIATIDGERRVTFEKL
jgi:hypothetical protein